MSHLEELSLYIRIVDGSTFVGGTGLDNKILIHMPRLHIFTFYIVSENIYVNPTVRISNNEVIQRTFAKEIYRHASCMVDYLYTIFQILYLILLFI
jgi:hypothetical protein